MKEAPALSAIGLHKAFGSTLALRGANLDLKAGKILSLLGENGSGKSTLAKIIAGVHAADAGKICRDGVEVRPNDPASARTLGIAMVFQELSLAPDLDAVDNLFLGRERRHRILSNLFDRKSQESDCRAMFEQLGLSIDLRKPIRNLGMAQKQMLEIGKALSQQPAILILDEPTASSHAAGNRAIVSSRQTPSRRRDRNPFCNPSSARGDGNRRLRQHHA